MLISLGKTTFV